MKRVIWLLFVLISVSLWSESIDELYQKREALREKGKYEEVCKELETYLKNNPDTEYKFNIYYDIACHYSLAGKNDQVFVYLNKVLETGFCDVEMMNSDEDFNKVKKDKRWNLFIKKVEKNYQDQLNTLPERLVYEQEIILPPARIKGSVSVEEALNIRRSVRSYKQEALSLEEVSQLLWSAYGVTKAVAVDRLRGGLKTAPSAGATYPLELYIYIHNVNGLEQGFYHFIPQGHKLGLLKKGNFANDLAKVCLSQTFIAEAPVSIIYSAVEERTVSVYGKRGKERYIPMDLGHSAENVYLQAEAMNMGTCAIGAFSDFDLKKLVGMSRIELPLYVMPVGKKK